MKVEFQGSRKALTACASSSVIRLLSVVPDWQGIELAPSEVREYPLETKGGEQVTP